MKSSFEPKKDEDVVCLNIDKKYSYNTYLCMLYGTLFIEKNPNMSLCQTLFLALGIEQARDIFFMACLEGK